MGRGGQGTAWLVLSSVGAFSSVGLASPMRWHPSPPASAQQESEERPIGSSEVNVSEHLMVDIVAQNDYVTNVLQKLAILGRRNIVLSNNVDQVVNATIYGVPFYDALEALLVPNGLGFVESGEFIFVYTSAELAKLQVGGFGPVTRVFELDYLRPADARDYVLPLLSSEGKVLISKDLTGEEGGEGGGGGGDATAAAEAAASGKGGEGGGGSSGSETVYTPELDEYDVRNAIVVHDLPEHIERVEAFLREIDTRPAQVLLEATIIQTTLSEANAFGVDFALLSGTDFASFFNFPTGPIPISPKVNTDMEGNITSPVPNGTLIISDPGNTGAGEASLRAGYIGDVGVFLRALDKVEDVTLLSNPKILALNRQRSKVFVGTRVGYLETTVVENQVLQTIKFIDTGISLDLRPFVLRNGRIRLELSPKVSEVNFREFESSDGVSQQIPDETVQTVTTSVVVPDGYTAVLGGLFREMTTRTRTQVPVLGDMPLLGALFRGHDDATEEVEIIFLIKVSVLGDGDLGEQGERALEYGERVRLGSRMGLLPWSRERQSARLNLEAERLLAQGEQDAALWKIRRSLQLHPIQPEVIRLYERLGDGPLWWPTRSYLERTIDEELDRYGDPPPPPEADEPTPAQEEGDEAAMPREAPDERAMTDEHEAPQAEEDSE